MRWEALHKTEMTGKQLEKLTSIGGEDERPWYFWSHVVTLLPNEGMPRTH